MTMLYDEQGRSVEVTQPAIVTRLLRSGYSLNAPGQVLVAGDTGGGQPDVEIYDPAEHSVEEVQGYLAAHPERTDAVVAAERTGKARKGIVGE